MSPLPNAVNLAIFLRKRITNFFFFEKRIINFFFKEKRIITSIKMKSIFYYINKINDPDRLKHIRELLEQGHKNDVEYGIPVLIRAFQIDDMPLVKLILGYRPNLDQPDANTSMTPLQWAIFRENIPIIKLLVKAGANVNLPNARGQTPIDFLATMNLPNTIEQPIIDIIENKMDSSAKRIQKGYHDMITHRKNKIKNTVGAIPYLPPGEVIRSFPGGIEYHRALKRNEGHFKRKFDQMSFGKRKNFVRSVNKDIKFLLK